MERVFSQSDVVITTPFLAKAVSNWGFQPNSIIFDEFANWQDPDVFSVFLDLPNTERALFVGDNKQLCPLAFTAEGRKAWCHSLYDRFLERGIAFTRLNVQYRTYRPIYEMTSRVFYGIVQSSAPDSTADIDRMLRRNALSVPTEDGRSYRIRSAIGFLDVGHRATDTTPSHSMFNTHEALISLVFAYQLWQHGISATDIMILSPYRGQVQTIMRYLAAPRFADIRTCRVRTVDESQGSESKVVIVTFARNTGYLPTFIHTTQRVNVMTSRAQEAVFFVGDWAWVTKRLSSTRGNKLCEAMLFYQNASANGPQFRIRAS
ncbi:AAA domain-containing protein [Aspergillus insuetus]